MRSVDGWCKFGLGVLLGVSMACFPSEGSAAKYTTLYSFTKGADGAGPYGGLVQGADDTFYGTTVQAGDPSCKTGICNSFGTVFSFTHTGGLKTILRFTGPNGNGPGNTLLLRGSTLYGNTGGGGTSNKGVLFSVQTDGSGYTLLHQFNGTDGAFPTGTPQRAANGTLYGVAPQGGANGFGVFFSVKPDGTYTILHTFTGGADGGAPTSLLMSSDGTLYGSTYQGGATTACAAPFGCGIVFSFVPATAKFSVVSTFLKGEGPLLGSIGPGPTIYGTVLGLSGNVIFSIAPSGSSLLATLRVYNSGVQYPGPTLAKDGSLLLTDGPSGFSGTGNLLRVANGKVRGRYGFGQSNGGGYPTGQPIESRAGSVLGTTSRYGLCDDCGTLYEVTP